MPQVGGRIRWTGWGGIYVGSLPAQHVGSERGSGLSSGCRRRSKTLTAGQRREMGWLLVPKSAVLPGLGTRAIIPSFKMAGILQWLIERV